MIRGINSIYNQAPHVKNPEDVVDFLFFVKSWTGWVGDHHHLEETKMFLGFEQVIGKPGFLQINMEQHHAFGSGLKKLEAFANDTKPEEYKFDTLQDIIDRFASALHCEISTLIAMRPYESEALSKVYKECEAAAGEQDKVHNSFRPRSANLLVTDADRRLLYRRW